MTEATFNVDSLGENIQYTGSRAQFAQVYTLIRMKKKTDPLNPDKGVDINSYYYAFNDLGTLTKLETDIQEQIRIYTPYTPVSVSCTSRKMKDGKYVIAVIITLRDFDDTLVVLSDGEQTMFDTL